MVVSDTEEIGSLFKRKKKKAAPPPVAPNTNFNFPLPGAPMVGPAVMPDAGPVMAPGLPAAPGLPMGPTLAPTFLGDNMPWIIGGGVLLVGVVTVVILWKMGKI